MKCPNCGAAGADGSAECGACGLLFSKWKERQERMKHEAQAALALAESRVSSLPNPWVGRGIAMFFVVLWIAGLAYFTRKSLRSAKADGPRDSGEIFIEMRDPAAGNVKRLGPPPPSSD